ncbi:MAG: hypothetical protein IJU16_04065, partial [Clostridia bacterium]|nr:hypothetical protein [Clostridia bacterium]
FDTSTFVNRLLDSAFRAAWKSPDLPQTYFYGTYSITENGDISANDNTILRFSLNGKRLFQLDDQGNEFLKFTKVS